MVKTGFTPDDARASQAAAERRVILSYVRAEQRTALAALLALDDALADVLRSTRDPLVGRIRLAWWRDALAALDTAPPPAEPVLAALARSVLQDVTGEALSGLTDGWDALLDDPPLSDAALADYAEGRGARLFGLGATILHADAAPAVLAAGRAWALADLASHSSDPRLMRHAQTAAEQRHALTAGYRWPRALRPLGAMALLSRLGDAGAGRRIGRIMVHRLTGF